MKNLRLLLVGILVSVAGFQAGQPVQAAATDNGSFMSLWGTYSHCQAITGVDQLREDALTLTHAADGSLTQEGFVLPLPGKLEKFVSTPAARFAVDVNAMAAACSLRAASAALEAGQVDLAIDLLQPILRYQPQSEYAAYTLQAQTLLYRLEPNVVQILP